MVAAFRDIAGGGAFKRLDVESSRQKGTFATDRVAALRERPVVFFVSRESPGACAAAVKVKRASASYGGEPSTSVSSQGSLPQKRKRYSSPLRVTTVNSSFRPLRAKAAS